MARKILDIATFGLAGAIFGGKKKAPAPLPAQPAAPAVMPEPDDQRIMIAKRRAIAAQMGRRGRESTILTGNPGDKLGG